MERDFAAINDECPKCGEPFLHVKDWGRTGALFVHGYNTDGGSGFRFLVACQVPEKVALGLESMEDWRGRKARPESEHFYQSAFGMDSLPGPYVGWTDGGEWNGWATPFFEFGEALHIVKDYVEIQIIDGEVHEAHYDEERDVFVFRDPFSDEEEIYRPEFIQMNGREVKIYSIGTNYWTWKEVNNRI